MRFPSVSTANVGFVTSDRDRFYRQWGFGFRYTKFNPGSEYESPQTFTLTLGQDELITGGRFQPVVARFDAFYPLPIGKIGGMKDGKWKFLYIFGTTSLRLARGDDREPLVLQPAPSTVNAFDKTVSIVAVGSNRDTYRLGIGVDFTNLMRSVFLPK